MWQLFSADLNNLHKARSHTLVPLDLAGEVAAGNIPAGVKWKRIKAKERCRK